MPTTPETEKPAPEMLIEQAMAIARNPGDEDRTDKNRALAALLAQLQIQIEATNGANAAVEAERQENARLQSCIAKDAEELKRTKANMATMGTVMDEVRSAVFAALLKANLNASVREGTSTIELINELGRTIAGALESYRESALARDKAQRELEARGQAIADAMGKHRGMLELVPAVQQLAAKYNGALETFDAIHTALDNHGARPCPERNAVNRIHWLAAELTEFRQLAARVRDEMNTSKHTPLGHIFDSLEMQCRHLSEQVSLLDEQLGETRSALSLAMHGKDNAQ